MNTASDRGSPKRMNARTIGFSRIAISAATMKMNTAWLTAGDQLPQADHGQRQPDQLHPARDLELAQRVAGHRPNLAAAPVATIDEQTPGFRVP